MSLLDFIAAVAGGWLILAALGGTSWAFVATRAKRRRPTVVRATYPPPVPHPAPTQADIDATWLDAWPTDVWLTDELVDRLFDDIVAIEGLDR